jgi:hypothetical protein
MSFTKRFIFRCEPRCFVGNPPGWAIWARVHGGFAENGQMKNYPQPMGLFFCHGVNI